MFSTFTNAFRGLRAQYTQAQSNELMRNNNLVTNLCGHVVIAGLGARALSSLAVIGTVALTVLFAPVMGTATLAGMAIKLWFFANLFRVSENLIKLGMNPAQVIESNPQTPQALVTELTQHRDAIKTALKADTYYFGVGIDIFADGALFLAELNVFPRVTQTLPR
jgi:hypothetical protein